MSNSTFHSVVRASSVVFALSALAACAAPVGGEEAETTESKSEALLPVGKTPPIIGKPVYASSCAGFNPTTGATDSNSLNTTSVSPCVSLDPSATQWLPAGLPMIELSLVANYHCSAPVYVKRVNPQNPSIDWWDAYMQLCPLTALPYYNQNVIPGGKLPNATSAPHVGTYTADPMLTPPGQSMFWAVTWEDPICMMGTGCSVTKTAM